MAASTAERRPRATYQDVLDAPAHRVAEIIDGTLYTHPRPAPAHTVASSVLGGELDPHFIEAGVAREDGGFSTSRNSTSVRTSWCQTSRAGAASG